MTPLKKPPEEKPDDDRDEFTFGKFRYRGYGLEKFGWALPVALLILSLGAALCVILFGLAKILAEMNRANAETGDVDAAFRPMVVCCGDEFRDDVFGRIVFTDFRTPHLLSWYAQDGGAHADGHGDYLQFDVQQGGHRAV